MHFKNAKPKYLDFSWVNYFFLIVKIFEQLSEVSTFGLDYFLIKLYIINKINKFVTFIKNTFP